MHNYTSDTGLLNVMIKSPSVSTMIFNSVIRSYDIKNVLMYQIFLIESLRSLFSKQIMDVLQNISSDSHEDSFQLYKLCEAFHDYMDLIPDNYPPTFLKFINDIENALTDYLASGTKNVESLKTVMNNILSTKSIIHLDTKNSKIDSMTITSITNLIKNIKKSPHFQPFKQTFEILLQEPHILTDYYILDKTIYEKITKSSYEPSNTCLIAPKIRTAFIWIWALLNKMPDEELKDPLNSYLTNVFEHVTYLNEFNGTKLNVKKTLLHLLNHVNNSTSQLFKNFSSSEFVILKQLVLRTIISMDYQELNNCNVNQENYTLYSELMTCSRNLTINGIKTEIDYAMMEICKMTDKPYHGPFGVQKGETHIHTITSSDKVDSDRIHFFPDIYKKQVLHMCQNLYQEFKTPDNHQIDSKFQLTVLEWYLYQAYTNVLYMFKIPSKLPSTEQIGFIKESLKKLRKCLTFSTYLMRTVLYFINIYLDYFENKTIEQETINKFTDIVNEQYKAFNVDKLQEIDNSYNSFKKNIEFIEYYFIDTNNKRLTVDKNDFTVSMFVNELQMQFEKYRL